MFGNKKQKIDELIIELDLVKTENNKLKEDLNDYNFLKYEGVEGLINFDYQGLVSFEGLVNIVSGMKIKEGLLYYFIDIYKNSEFQRAFTVNRNNDTLMVSPLANKRRRDVYLLTLDIAKFVERQFSLYKERMGSNCEIILENKLPDEFNEII